MTALRLRNRFASTLVVLLVGVGLFVSPQGGCIVAPSAAPYCAVEHLIPASHSIDTTVEAIETVRVSVILPARIPTTFSKTRDAFVRPQTPSVTLPPIKPWRDRHVPYASAMRDA